MSLPPNVHVSKHPCLLAKLSRLRSEDTQAREVKSLVHEISLVVGCEAFASALTAADGPKGKTPIGYEYTTTTTEPQEISIVPILRSGLGMVDGPYTNTSPDTRPRTSPRPVPRAEHPPTRRILQQPPQPHRNQSTGRPRLEPSHHPRSSHSYWWHVCRRHPDLKRMGSQEDCRMSVIAASDGVRRAAAEWPGAVEIWVGGVDDELTPTGMIKPGLGDIGDRIFLTIGK
ncbi:hypothetical protein O1611_g8210 [Lasiodiplodia mahajangana]|uniref:Uncharacterized protein n=1 Tax=Lasiodiplodia mahajangana TaxID=1108764 RepID=A0ACC2JDI7_9PEZI|nr:hypothetical protein O1611_g8210 [Lasiodiplodia mahajangana]